MARLSRVETAWASGCSRLSEGEPSSGGASSVAYRPGRTHFFVAQRADDAAGSPIGCVAVKCEHTQHGERQAGVATVPYEASIWRLTVAPRARRLGVGRLLMAEAEAFARTHGCRDVSLITGNAESLRFDRALGYAPETEARARLVLFGPARQPRGALGQLRARYLRTRLARPSILHKAL